MFTDDEKDYIMRMIKEIARVLASVMLGKKYVQVELPVESKYQISGDKLHHLKTMVDQGEVNEAENELYVGMVEDDVDYLELALTFYLYLNDMDGDFLDDNGYSREEVLDGMKELASDWGVTGLEAF